VGSYPLSRRLEYEARLKQDLRTGRPALRKTESQDTLRVAVSSSVAAAERESRIRPAFRRQRGLQVAEVPRDDCDIRILEGSGEALHDGVLAAALPVLIQGARNI